LNLQVVVADIADCQKELTIEIPASDVQSEYNKAYDAYARHAKIPGFRPGKVPKAVVKQRFAKEIKGEVLNSLLPHAIGHAIEDHKLKVIGSPNVNPDDIDIKEGEALSFKSQVTVLPDFELKNYQGIPVTKRVARVTDEAVEKAIEVIREQSAQLIPVEDRASLTGDFVSINLVGKYIDPPAEEDLKTEDLVIELGAQGVQPEFNDNLTGVKEGEVKAFTVKYPQDFPSQGLAGKTLDFTATINSVKIKELPELNDEFAEESAEEFGANYKDVAGLREQVRKDIAAANDHEAEMDLRDDLLANMAKEYDFPLPAPLIEQQANQRMQDFIQRLMQSGAYAQIAAKDINWEARQEEERVRAKTDVKLALILGAVAQAENVVISQEDMDNEIERIAESMGRSAEEVEANLTKNDALSSIENRLRSNKVIDLLVSKAEITTEEYDEEDEPDIPVAETEVTAAGEAAQI
jgi:trigger factor